MMSSKEKTKALKAEKPSSSSLIGHLFNVLFIELMVLSVIYLV